jgi:GNAT superfamily N-acetyltransferase
VSQAVQVAIRQAVPGDARAIAEVHVASWRWAYRGHLPEETLAALDVGERASWWREVLNDAARIVLLAARDDGTIVGFAHAAATDDADGTFDVAQLYAIYLEERAAGQGIGGALLGRVTGEMRRAGFTRACLWVLETNERARRFYERAGWAWDGTRSTHQVQCSNLPIVRYRVEL